MGNRGKFTKKQSRKTNVFSLYFRSDFRSGDETYTAGGETPIVGLPAFRVDRVNVVGARIYFTVKTE